MQRIYSLSLTALSLLALSTLAPSAQAQFTHTIVINTSGLNGQTGGLAFDFIAGDNVTPNNSILINSFTTDGTLIGASNTNVGDAQGDLPGSVVLEDSGFTESFRGLTFGNTLSFTYTQTSNFSGPGGPDEFAFYLTNLTNTGALVQTDDPTGANALFTLDITGPDPGTFTLYNPLAPGVVVAVDPVVGTQVPEPSSLALAAATLMVGGGLLRARRRRR